MDSRILVGLNQSQLCVVKYVCVEDGIVPSGEPQDFTFVRTEVHLPGSLPLLEGVQVLFK